MGKSIPYNTYRSTSPSPPPSYSSHYSLRCGSGLNKQILHRSECPASLLCQLPAGVEPGKLSVFSFKIMKKIGMMNVEIGK